MSSAAIPRAGVIAPIVASTIQAETTTTSSSTAPHLPLNDEELFPSSSEPQRPRSDFGRLQLAPATRQTIVTTTTTTTVHFAPILLPRTIRPASTTIPPLSPTSAFIQFAQDKEQIQLELKLDPKLYPLSQSSWPGGLGKFRIPLGAMEATFEAGAVDERFSDEPETSNKPDDGRTGSKGKGTEDAFTVDSNGRGAHAHRRKSRKARIGLGTDLDHIERASSKEFGTEMTDGEALVVNSPRSISPGPPRKRPRAISQTQQLPSHPMEYPGIEVKSGLLRTVTNNLPTGGFSSCEPTTSSSAILQEGPIELNQTARLASRSLEDPQEYDLGTGEAISGLLSLPDFVNTFDLLTPTLQAYFIYALLKRSSVPVLQTINNIISPSLRRDFLTDLPPELGIHILGYLDVKPLCRASIVCRGWRGLVDGEWRVWKERLASDGLWIGDGSEGKEVDEITTGVTESIFLKRWRTGVWDDNQVQSVSRSSFLVKINAKSFSTANQIKGIYSATTIPLP
jgi:F-box and WD-40 domain protein CDC4